MTSRGTAPAFHGRQSTFDPLSSRSSVSTDATAQPQLEDPWAVVLYAPEETIWCSWIHRQLDGILVPEAMVGRPTRHGFPLPASITIFPDPEDPAKLALYAEAVQKARYLIVVCSPASADAESVEQQIRAFKRTGGEGGEERIVVLVVERELDEGSNSSTGKGGDTWLPPWIRWRLGEDGQFRAEQGEPLIIDARPGRLSLDDARGALMSLLMDFGRTDRVPAGGPAPKPSSPAAPASTPAVVPGPPAPAVRQPVTKVPTPSLPPMAPVAAVPVAVPAAKKGISGLAIAALGSVLVLAGALWFWMRPPPPSPSDASTSPVAAATPASEPPAAVGEPLKPADIVAAPEPVASKPVPTPEPPPAAVASAPVTAPAAPSASSPAFPAGSDVSGPVTSIAPPPKPKSELNSVAGTVSGDAALDRWRKLRELGDTYIAGDKRDAGILALAEAAEAGENYLQKERSASIRIEVARLSFRLAALQRQYESKDEATKSLARARRILEHTKASGEEASERRRLLEDIDTFLAGMKE